MCVHVFDNSNGADLAGPVVGFFVSVSAIRENSLVQAV